MLKKLSSIVFLTALFWAPLQFSYADYDSITVNIPDSNGGYRTIVIKKSGDGYIGPQGEHYSSFPTVYQLENMYRSAPEVRDRQRSEESGPVVQIDKTQITVQNIPVDTKDLKIFDFKKKKKSTPAPNTTKSAPSSQNGQAKKPDSSNGNHT